MNTRMRQRFGETWYTFLKGVDVRALGIVIEPHGDVEHGERIVHQQDSGINDAALVEALYHSFADIFFDFAADIAVAVMNVANDVLYVSAEERFGLEVVEKVFDPIGVFALLTDLMFEQDPEDLKDDGRMQLIEQSHMAGKGTFVDIKVIEGIFERFHVFVDGVDDGNGRLAERGIQIFVEHGAELFHFIDRNVDVAVLHGCGAGHGRIDGDHFMRNPGLDEHDFGKRMALDGRSVHVIDHGSVDGVGKFPEKVRMRRNVLVKKKGRIGRICHGFRSIIFDHKHLCSAMQKNKVRFENAF